MKQKENRNGRAATGVIIRERERERERKWMLTKMLQTFMGWRKRGKKGGRGAR